ncbi:hypothetical protein DL96DRAFT_1690018 [Flagelloscypha sp. PMI_526]|nr:hypothetical protein DL96DRAFT_1690018 [Flagelloscypha sp. PMI_526]
MSSTVPAAITQAINLLTTPLLTTHSVQAIAPLRALLQANLVVILPITGEIHLNFKLSPYTLPPKPILASCVASGITWAEWSRALGGKPLEVLITNSGVRMTTAVQGRPVTVFRNAEDANNNNNPINVMPATTNDPFVSKVRPDVAIARRLIARPTTDRASTATPPLRIPTSGLRIPAPTSKLSQSFSPFDDSDSDSDSDISRPSSRLSTFSFESSSDGGSSMTSASSFSSSPVSTKAKSTAFSKVIAPPVINRAHQANMNYLYEGGSTRVMTGGVMLGGAPRAAATSSSPIKKAATVATARKGSEAGSWRRGF